MNISDMDLDKLTLENISAQFCSDWLKYQIRKLIEERDKAEADVAAMRKACVDIYNALPIPPINPDHTGYLYDIGNLALNAIKSEPGKRFLEQREKMLAVVEAAKGFKEHGEAKNGTHAQIFFKALDDFLVMENG